MHALVLSTLQSEQQLVNSSWNSDGVSVNVDALWLAFDIEDRRKNGPLSRNLTIKRTTRS